MRHEQPTQSHLSSQNKRFRDGIGLVVLVFFAAIMGTLAFEDYLFSKTLTVANSSNSDEEVLLSTPTLDESGTQSSSTMSETPTQPATTPLKPAPTPPTEMPTMPAHAFGISMADTLSHLNDAELQETFNTVRELGITWIRIDFDWSVIQHDSSDVFDWERLDRVITAARDHDIQVLPILTYTPRWARQRECRSSSRCMPSNPDDFGRFAAAAVDRYAAYVHTWEIWNEPNIDLFWLPYPDPEAYTSLLSAAYAAIKKNDPTATVITGGLSPAATQDGDIAPIDFLSELYASGARDSFDAVGFHPYSFPVTASYAATWNAWEQMTGTNPSLRSVMIVHGDADKKIWLTEYGAPTGGPGIASDGYDPREETDHVTEALQAEILADAMQTVQTYPWAAPLFWHSYQDLGTSDETVENFFGLLRYDGSEKPAYRALRDALQAQ